MIGLLLSSLLLAAAATSSYRRTPNQEEALSHELRQLNDRLERIERGSLFLGPVSFGEQIFVGGVEISIIDGIGGAKTLQFRNVATGATHLINL